MNGTKVSLFSCWLLLMPLVVGCQSAPASGGKDSGAGHTVVATPIPAGQARILSENELQQASKLYKDKCARCHKLYKPTRYTDAQWNSWMKKMSRKARLKPEQDELLTQYLAEIRHPNTTGAK